LVRDADGQPVEAVGSWSDITERKQLEEQYRQAQKMEAVGKLAGGVAHDFNNLLTVIMGYSQMFLGKLRPEDPFRIPLTEIYKAGERATGLTRQLLAFSRKQVLMPVVLDLSTIIADMEKMLRRLIGEDVILTFLAGADLWKVKADPGQMEQVVMNILVNARDAMPEGGKVLLETRNVELDNHYVQTHPDAKPGEHVLLAISDSGCGMNASVKARIFEPFFTTKGPTKGTGLGLATVFGIVKQSGGHIDVYSEVGQGTTFKIYLPRDKSGEPIASRSRIIEPVRGGTETILLVEDEEGVRNLAGTVLQQRGYKVLDAMNGGEALVICETLSQPIDLMITDVVMPHFSGRQLADRLATRQPTMKVLYMSGYTDDAIVHHGVLESGIPFLQKPFAPEALARKVREVLDNILGQTIPSAPDNKTTGNQ
jgi:nitrogen-specific signal transduction histidine kinase/CheY-like chemotaxis protein